MKINNFLKKINKNLSEKKYRLNKKNDIYGIKNIIEPNFSLLPIKCWGTLHLSLIEQAPEVV